MGELTSLLETLPLLTMLPSEVRDAVIQKFEPVTFPFGSVIVREGELADAFYVLASGRARVVKRAENGDEVALGVLRPGDSFGEAALLSRGARSATVRASGNCEVLRLDRQGFEELVATRPEFRAALELQVKHRTVVNFFRQHSVFAQLSPVVTRDLVTRVERVTAEAGELVIREGDDTGKMYVVEEGRLRAFSGSGRERRDVAFLRLGDLFGEVSLLRAERSSLSVEAVSRCRLFALSRDHFEALCESSPELRTLVEERVAQLDFRRTAKVPLDFASEILPAEATAAPPVSDDQVEEGEGESPEAPFASAEGFFVRKPARIRRFPFVSQVDEMDCGAAALAMVCRHFGRRVSLSRIRQLVHTSIDGTSLRGLCSAAVELGLAARSIKASRANLTQMPLPAIVHWKGDHWIVLYDSNETHVRVADPALGLRRLSRQQFERDWSGYAALFDYTPAFERAPQDEAGVPWLWSFFRPHSVSLLQAVLLAVVVSGLQMALPVFTQVIVDSVLVDRDASLLRMLILAMLAVLVFSTVASFVQRYLLSFVALRVDSASLDFVTRKLLSLPMGYFATRRTGDIQRRLQGIREVRQFLVQHGVSGLMALVQLAVAVALMVAYSSTLAGVFLCTLPLYGLLMAFSSRRLRPIFHDLEEASAKYHSYQIDAIKGIETVKAMGAEGPFRELMLSEFLRVGGKRFNADFTVLLYEGAVTSVAFLSTVLFLWMGANQVMDGKFTIGALVAFNSLIALANQPLLVLLTLWDGWQLAVVLVNRLNDVLTQEPEQGVDRSSLLPVPTLEGRIRFENIGFRYGGPEAPPILEGVSFEAPPGKTIAIVGRSGSGKTTLIKCLAGLLEPSEGRIFYDGVDLRTLNYRDLRRQIGFVLQENYLFNDTIARNIAFGEDEPDVDQVQGAARAANAHDFIERLPLGYDTRIGESGIAISGGQRQRIAIARAIYHQPAVLVFDEATSALDSESERAVKESLDQLLARRTSFVIAHRLSTIRDADLILVLEKGRLVESGAHDELMKRQGLYYYLCSQQLGL